MAEKVIIPKLEIAQDTVKVIEWLKEEGDTVQKGETLLVIETDKVTVEIESPGSGVLGGIQAHVGEEIPLDTVIAYILEPGEKLPQEAEKDMDLGKIHATPAARRLAKERGIDLSSVKGSGPQGRIQADDIPAGKPFAAAPGPLVGERIPLEGMRKTIAERMTISYQTTPHISFTVRVDMGGVEEARQQLNAEAQEQGLKRVSITAFMVVAVAWGLKRHPYINSVLVEGEIHLLPDINVGVAVALDEGLIVPVVHNADQLSILEVSNRVNDIVERARSSKLTPSDVAGGTFTISNLGPFGIEQFTAIINPPQTGVLAVGTCGQEVVPNEDGQLLIKPMMRMTLSADHRVIDGAIAARFMNDVKDALERPWLMQS